MAEKYTTLYWLIKKDQTKSSQYHIHTEAEI